MSSKQTRMSLETARKALKIHRYKMQNSYKLLDNDFDRRIEQCSRGCFTGEMIDISTEQRIVVKFEIKLQLKLIIY